jgi:hypothetical protein
MQYKGTVFEKLLPSNALILHNINKNDKYLYGGSHFLLFNSVTF